MIIDIIIVGLIILASIVALILILVKWKKEQKLFWDKQKQLIEESRKVENSSLVG